MKRDTIITCKESGFYKNKIMTTVVDGSYQQLNMSSEAENDDDNEHHEPEFIIHVVPETGKTRWNHIEDLDSFFTRMYYYHQKHGFKCIILEEFLELVIYSFVILFSIFLFHGINYTQLFADHKNKTSIFDPVLPLGQWTSSMGLLTWSSVLIASIFCLFRVVKFCCHIFQYRDIGCFFNYALKINDADLDNLTWHEVQKKIIEVQKEQEMCIHKRELTELDIYHRILRFKNYLVAMINKSLLPLHLQIPLFGDIIFLTQGLKYNLELILFWGPWSPFENNWHLREDYKKLNKRHELAKSLSNQILWIGIVNFLLCPVIFLWQILYFIFNYGELLKREPGVLGIRTWSLYAKLYLRHFNELDHELNARLNRAYRPASKYMNMFTSPMMTIIAKPILFISGSVFFVLFVLACYDEDLLTLEHFLLLMTMTGTAATVCRSLVPDENLVWCPESLLTTVLAHTHYRPDNWRNQAHLQSTRAQFSHLFQYRAAHLLDELLSPLLTPYILCFQLRHKAMDIVDFYRNFTIEVTGVGDVCSFAQMDVRKHGNPAWQTMNGCNDAGTKRSNAEQDSQGVPVSNQYTQAEDGKTELSLIHFTHTNPKWKPPNNEEKFVTTLREKAKREVANVEFLEDNALITSLSSISNLGPEYSDIVSNILRNNAINEVSTAGSSMNYNQRTEESSASQAAVVQSLLSNLNNSNIPKMARKGASKAEGPLYAGERSLLLGLQQQLAGTMNQSFSASGFASGIQDINAQATSTLEFTTVDMSLSTLYLHELHHRYVTRQRLPESVARSRSALPRSPLQDLETLPELGQERAPLLQHQDSSVRNQKQS